MDFDKWYRSKIESQPESPPGEVWDAIQDDLDVEAVWTRLGPELTPAQTLAAPPKQAPAKVRTLYQRLAIAASLLLLAAFGGIYLLVNSGGDALMVAEEPTMETPAPTDSEPHTGAERQIATGTVGLAAAPSTPSATSRADQLPAIDGPVGVPESTRLTSMEYVPAATMELMPAVPRQPALGAAKTTALAETGTRSLAEAGTRSLAEAGETLLAAAADPSESYRIFSEAYVGVGGTLANTWLLNDKTINGLKPADLTNTHASFGQNFGIMAGTRLSNRSWLRLEWYFVSQSRQRYDEYINGQYVSTSTNLNYQSLSAALHVRPGRAGSPHYLGAGLYAGLLRDALQEINGNTLDVAGNYTSMDYGVVAGYEFVSRLSPGLTLSTGVYGKYGLNNVFAGDGVVPPYLNHTRNAALMVSFALHYSIW